MIRPIRKIPFSIEPPNLPQSHLDRGYVRLRGDRAGPCRGDAEHYGVAFAGLNKNPRMTRGFFVASATLALFLVSLLVVGLQEARELLLEARQPAAAIEQMLLAAGPGRVRFRVDVEMHDIALLAPGRAGG